MATKAEVWRERLAACRASGESTAAFCREHGWSYAQCMYWQRRLGRDVRGLIPVQVKAQPASSVSLSVDVTLADVAVRVHGASVSDVVALVRGLSC